MGLLDDLHDEVNNYAHNYLELSIVQVDPPGDFINEDEDVAFRIQVSNPGPLDVNNLSLLVTGLNGTDVKSNGTNSAYVDSFTISGAFFGNVPAHETVVSPGPKFHFKTSRDSAAEVALVQVSVANWATTFDHILASTPPDPEANGIYGSTVLETVNA